MRRSGIVDLVATNESAIQQVAELLVEGFARNWPYAWPDMKSALEEVRSGSTSLASGI